ncbi:hypothetical protein G647_05331 [Cladophialophora carrionii CBS 160.54]|uniref:Subtelomeric hrmA-associated cluster protein AFUB-079030/YDR124W-like helical bundle domain-containing protein n=1 Tax=Cladophialophora carrionii CBS 160.54 TaxID=1279043 RepID=V9D9D2_9EURO|nr:uncharacterized protein G647_05331 [Cladophialophora carrionii CBS 160.54]ETI23529.1 hypothetical protein G647_05331 [Cladophialophora carrionii CBS 160.54]
MTLDMGSPQTGLTSADRKEDIKAEAAIVVPALSREERQLHLINEIKKLVADCEDFIGLVPGPRGVPEIVVSPNLKKDKWTIIRDAQETFTQFLSMRTPSGKGNSCGSSRHCGKVFKAETDAEARAPGGSISLSVQRPLKRHRSRKSALQDPSYAKSRHGGGGVRVVESSASQIRVDDDKALAEWYRDAFLGLQQVSCRLVAKIWIKKIHPKKQSTHPYNGQMPRNTTPDSDRTRPPYWPIDVRHREPDHIGKDERTQLLVHLLMNTPQPVVTNPPPDPVHQQFVYAQDLLECLEPKKGERELTNERWDTIEQIIRTRQMQEQYAAGEIDGDTLIFLADFSNTAPSKLGAINSEDDELEFEGNVPGISSEGSDAAAENREPTPDTSTQTSPADQATFDGSVPISRLRGSADTMSFPGRRMATRRSRPSFIGGQVPPSIPIHTEASFCPELSMSMESSMPHGDAAMLSLVGMTPRLPSLTFGRMENHTGTSELMHITGHSGHPAANLHLSNWPEIPPDMGPDPPAEMFGIPPTMTPSSMRHPYFGAERLDAARDLQGGMHPAMLSPVQYNDYGDGTRRDLPFRALDPQHPTMMPTQDVNMGMMGGHFY